MKRIINLLTIAAISVLLHSCSEQEHFEVPMNEDIVLDLVSSTTRAAAETEESFVEHIDVFIFEEENGAPTDMAHYERRQVNNARQLTLSAKRSAFEKDARYRVYLIANSHIASSTFSRISHYSELLPIKQEDPLLHLTGLSISGLDNPKYFLMDAIAKGAGDNMSIVLNDGNLSMNTVLSATLRRAAAKVQVTIDAAANIQFKNFSEAEGSVGGTYYVSNLSYDAYLLAEAKNDEDIEAKVHTTSQGTSRYFVWDPESSPKKVSLTVYAYPNHWSDEGLLEHETCIVMNLPMVYTDGVTVTNYPNSWYKIPMTNDQTLRRNNYYEVNITLNRPGAILESKPEEVDNIHYLVADWVGHDINVGGGDKPKYLMVNQTEMEMYNTDLDDSTLEFSSSSPVTVTVKDIYYYNKYGIKTTENVTIKGTPDAGIAGKIAVNSPNPTKNTIRYFTLVITNQEGLTKEVQVEQYPLVYITNIQSYYSYRSDFLSNSGSPDGTATGNILANRQNYTRFGVNYSWGAYSYVNNSSESQVFFRSKFVNKLHSSGLSDVDTYSQYGTSNLNDSYNARMYHIRITASSDEYVLGRPKITNGVTDSNADNARMVSPSFMIASQLGTVLASMVSDNSRKIVYTEHAKQYVEVYVDPETGKEVHLSDWRLPTAAELEIIYKYQGTSNDPANADAIDFLLGGEYYYSASGAVKNPKPTTNSSGTFIRCIRDVYEIE